MTDLTLPPGFAPVHNRYVLPSFVERTSYGVKESNPYNKMFEDRIIFLGVQVDDASANDVMAQLPDAGEHRPGPRHHHVHQLARRLVHSHDGDLRHDAVRPSRTSSPVCLGQAASAAAVLLGRGHARQADGAAALPDHHPPAGHRGWLRSGLGHRDPGAGILRMRTQLEEMLARHSNQPIEKVRKDIDRDKIMTAEETKEYGLVDTVLVSRKKSLQTAGVGS
jgi:ATP-dependent Clp protease protease subunit